MAVPFSPQKPINPSLHLGDVRDGDLENYTREKLEKLTGNPNYPADGAFPEKEAVTFALSEYVPALAKAEDGDSADTEDKDAKRILLENALTALAIRCSQIANGSMAKFLSSGFEARKEREAGGVLTAPENLSARDGTQDGSVALEWNPLDDAKSFVVEITETPNDEASYAPVLPEHGGVSTKSETQITELTPGKRYWFRVAGINTEGIGKWSVPATRIPQ